MWATFSLPASAANTWPTRAAKPVSWLWKKKAASRGPTMTAAENPRPPFPPFDAASAAQKVRMAEDAWNTRDPVRVSLAYTPDSVWRNRSEFFTGREAIVQFLTRKWSKELDYRLIKELW